MKLKKKIILLIIILIPLLFSSVFATWIIMKNVSLTPSYDPNAQNIFTEAFGNQSVDYTGGMQKPSSSLFRTGDVSFSYREAYSNDTYEPGGPFDAGTYEILVKSNLEEEDYVDTVVLFTINPIEPTITVEPTFKPTIEGEQPITKTGTVNGLKVDGTLSGDWEFNISDLDFGIQTTDSIQISNKICTFTPNNKNYTPVSTTANIEILATAKIENTYYGTVEIAVDNATDGNNIFVLPNINSKTGYYPTIKRENLTINSGVTLTLTQNEDDLEVGYFIYSNKEAYQTPTTTTTYGAQLCVSSNTVLNIYGILTIGAFVQPSSIIYDKRFGVLMNHGNILLKSNGTINSYGYLKGTGIVELESNSNVNDLFAMYDFPSVRYAGGIYIKSFKNYKPNAYNNVLPFNCYSIHNISCKIKAYAGCNYYGIYQINISNSIYTGKINFIGSSGLFKISNGFLEREIYSDYNKTTGYTQYDNSSYTVGNQNIYQIEKYDFSCSVSDNSISINLSLLGYFDLTISTSPNVSMPIGMMHFNFKNSSIGSFTKNSYKFLPGSLINVESGAKLQFGSSTKIVLYNEYYDNYTVKNQSGTDVTSSWTNHYYKKRSSLYDGTNIKESYIPVVNVYGTLQCDNQFGGIVNKYTGASVTIKTSSATIPWLTSITELSDSTAAKLVVPFITTNLGGSVTDKKTNAIINEL